MTLSLHYFADQAEPAIRLAQQMNCPVQEIMTHNFPDGEVKVTVAAVTETILLYTSLDHPNGRLISLALAASALRDNGARRIVLVAPYLCYMRQDMAFKPGEAVSQRVIGAFLAGYFDRIVTVDPHLHRTPDLQTIFPGCEADRLSATGPIAEAVRQGYDRETTLLIGPDSESRQWVDAIAGVTGLSVVIAEKIRTGDRTVTVKLPDDQAYAGKNALIVDDVISSGMTIARCAAALKLAGVEDIDVMATHMLCRDQDLAQLEKSEVGWIRSTDSIVHASNAICLAPLLAGALQKEK